MLLRKLEMPRHIPRAQTKHLPVLGEAEGYNLCTYFRSLTNSRAASGACHRPNSHRHGYAAPRR